MQIFHDEASKRLSIGSYILTGSPRHHRTKDLSLAVLLATLCVSLVACSATGIERKDSTAQDSSDTLTATSSLSDIDQALISDHMSVIQQIFNPLDTTLQITNSDSDVVLNVYTQLLASSGYGIQRVTADQGANFLSYSKVKLSNDQADVTRFTTQIGTIEISRDYRTPSGNLIVPASTFRLSGTRVEVAIDASEIANVEVTNPSYSTTSYIASMDLDKQSPVISLVTPDVVERVTSETVQSSRLSNSDQSAPTLRALNSNREQINNLFYSEASTFTSILDGYDKVDRQIIVFGNDSLVLGDTNKSLINQFVSSRVRGLDIISLVGCSNGHTELDIGNEGLALGRAKRVTEELQARGIGRDRILDEGCWAPVSAGEKFPARGVVMELWRRNS